MPSTSERRIIKTLFVTAEDSFYTLTIPDNAKITYGPWSPPSAKSAYVGAKGGGGNRGTLRVYAGSKENIIGLYTGVLSFHTDEVMENDLTPKVVEADYISINHGPLTMYPTAAQVGPSEASFLNPFGS